MLKLEKVAKTLELNVILRNKPALLTRTFLIALGYAVGCHCFALLLFHISPFKISYQASLIPPVYVASDFFPSDPLQHISVHFDEESYVPDFLIAPRTMPATLPAMRHQAEPAAKIVLKPVKAMEHSFALENQIDVQPLTNLFRQKKTQEPLSVVASGGLAERKLVVESAKTKAKDLIHQFALRYPSLTSAGPCKVVFSVMVEQDKGEIFWWEPRNENLDSSIVWLAISLLQNLRFEKGVARSIESGDIEMTLAF